MKDKAYFLAKAEENRPKLLETIHRLPADSHPMKTGDSILLDLGEHCVGHFSFSFDVADDFITAPVRFVIRFGEDLREIEDDYADYRGSLSATWLQEETVLLDYPQSHTMPRRYSCRYIRITVENTRRPIRLFDLSFTATSSADPSKLRESDTKDPLLKKIDGVAAATLKECMQSFFEDGPKRDRRLWIGDLRLEALTNYYTFSNLALVRRCLYLIAAGDKSALGFVPSYIYETPYFFSGRDAIADYALLYVVTLCDYYEHTKDPDTLRDLLPLCKSQVDAFEKLLDERGIVTPQKGWFSFIDWCPGLKGLTALQGVYLYTLERLAALLREIGDEDHKRYEALLQRLRKACKEQLFEEAVGFFRNSLDENQLSVHSQVWMILGGVMEGEEAKRALKSSLEHPEAKQPVTPYMWHYVIEAMLKLDLREDAVLLIKTLWGGQLDRGADTFYEVFVPSDPDFSPYRDRKINSLCHAWSCTPAYWIRAFGL